MTIPTTSTPVQLDLTSLATALGFMAVALQPGPTPADPAARARDLAALIEEFCRSYALPATQTQPSPEAALLEEAHLALQLCLAANPSTWEAEQEADAVCRKIMAWQQTAA